MLTGKRSIIIALVGISIVMALFVAAAPGRMQVATSNRSLHRFGLVGIARGQVARLNVVMFDPPDPRAPNGLTPQGVEPTPFRVRLGFVGANGIPLQDRAGNIISMEVSLLPGGGAWLDLETGDVLALSELRKQIRPVVSYVSEPDAPSPDPEIPVVVTLEIFNRLTGRTESLYSPASEPIPEGAVPNR
jgi:hypothetical protein